MTDCIFCKIIAGELPCYKVYEDEIYLAILDRYPSTSGATLILTKRHTADIFGLTAEESSGLMPLAKRIAEKMQNTLPDIKGVNILQNNGAAAGQVIFHYHMHILPRYDNDRVKISHTATEPTLSELEETAIKLKI
jgi:histidine triad (HIT) family protein